MPITSNASYLPTADEFKAHWSQVNAVLGAAPLILKGGIAIAGFQGLRDTLVANQAEVQNQRNEVQITRMGITLLRTAMLDALNKFNGLVDAYYSGTVFQSARPKVPGIAVNLLDFSDPMQDARSLWSRLELAAAPAGLTLPISLPVPVPALFGQAALTSVTLVSFTALLTLLQTSHAALKTAEQSLNLARKTRDATQEAIYDALKNYRTTVPSRLPSTSVLLQTLPRLTPEGGHTPNPVHATGFFVAPDKAKINFDASAEPTLDHYALHAVAGDEWSADDAEIIATLPKTATPREFLTAFSLNHPGAAATFSVYVVLTSGNEKGSPPVTVMRPIP